MYKEYLHTLTSIYCINVVLLLFNSSFILYRAVFLMSRRNTTFWSKVVEMGVGKQGISLEINILAMHY